MPVTGMSAERPEPAVEVPWDFVHLSHRKDIVRRVENREASSLQARYGGKGSGLIYIAYLGIPTRDGFIIPTVLPRLGLHKSEAQRFEQRSHQASYALWKVISSATKANPPASVIPAHPCCSRCVAARCSPCRACWQRWSFVGMTDEVAEALAL